MAGRWLNRSSSDNSWLNSNNACNGRTISLGGRKKSSTNLVNLQQTMSLQTSHSSRSLQEEEEPYASGQPPMLPNHFVGGDESVHMSTVLGTFPDNLRQWSAGMPANESQLSSLGGTPRWQYTRNVAPNGTTLPSQIELRRTPPNTSGHGENCQTSGSSNVSSSRGGTNAESSHQMSESTCSSSRSSSTRDNCNDQTVESAEAEYGNCDEENHGDKESQHSFSDGADALLHAANSASVSRNITNIPNTQETYDVPEWNGCNPDFILRRLKAIPREELEAIGKREFYKSYSSWTRMTVEQRNKTVSYFRSLTEELQGMFAAQSIQ
jgi:hypothetical protein